MNVSETKTTKPIIVSDAQCYDCNGSITVFGVPDKVWSALGLTTEWLCMGCVAKRINPSATANQLESEIRKHRKTFNLRRFNKICGEKVHTPNLFLFELSVERAGVETMTVAEVMGDFELPSSQLVINISA
jgi:hypothetical protein